MKGLKLMIKISNKNVLTKVLAICILATSFSLPGCKKETESELTSAKIKISNTKNSSEVEDQIERPELREKFEQAKKQNSDTVAWIFVPGTDIDYPVVQDLQNRGTAGEDYYIHRDFFGNRVAVGRESAIFANKNNTVSPFEDISKNLIISGHNVNTNDSPNGKMFAPLGYFKNLEFSKKTPYIFVTTEDKDLVYELFASYYAEERLFNTLFKQKMTEKDLEGVIEEVKQRSHFDYKDVDVTGKDKILTLYTCTYHFGPYKSLGYYRTKYLVNARLLSEDEKLKAEANVKVNPNPKKVNYSYCAKCNANMTVEKCTANYGLCDKCK